MTMTEEEERKGDVAPRNFRCLKKASTNALTKESRPRTTAPPTPPSLLASYALGAPAAGGQNGPA